jgi:glycosyltransferase involved in cell wall biosynthesis
MKVLFVSSLALFADTRFGGAKRLHYLAKELDERVDLHVICFDGSREWPKGEPFPKSFRNQLYVPMPPVTGGLSRLKFLPGVSEVLLGSKAAIESFMGSGPFDAVVMAYPIALAFMDAEWAVAFGRRIYLEDDLYLGRYGKDTQGPWMRRLSGQLRFRQSLSFFTRHAARLACFVCISKEEETLVRGYFPGLETRILKYGLPTAEYPPLGEPADPQVLGFIGNYGHTPNLDALRWLLEDIFPRMRAKDPGARLVVAGRLFPAELKALCVPDAGVTLLEGIDDLREFYSAIGIFINPVREGRGLRTKLVEAAAFGRPILSTRLGAEGLESLRISVCETGEEFAAARLAMSGDVYREAVSHNRAAVEREFSLEAVGGQLAGILAEGAAA